MHTVSICVTRSFYLNEQKIISSANISPCGDDVITNCVIVRRTERKVVLVNDLRKGQRITEDMIQHVLAAPLPALDSQSPSVTVTDGVRVPIKGKGMVSKTMA